MVFGMIGKYIRQLKLKETNKPPQLLNEQELQNLSKIRMILMNRAQIPEDFEHVGPENSDEEDQFYKYRSELVDIFKNTLDITGSKEIVIDELCIFIRKLNNKMSVEQIELPFFLLFHFAEKVNDIAQLLKSENAYSELIEYIIKFPIPAHKIVLKMYFENIVRHSAFFDTSEHSKIFPYVLSHFLIHLISQDKDIKKHTISLLYRLTVKNCLCLIPNVETLLQTITQCLQTELEQESVMLLYKTIGLIVGNKSINANVQLSLFSNLCDMICMNTNNETIFIFTEVMTGFSAKVSPEMTEKIKKSTEIILKAAFTGDTSTASIKCLCLLLQKLIDSLEEESAGYVKIGLEYLIDIINMETIEMFLQVLANCCHKIKANLGYFIPTVKLQSLIIQIMKNIHTPTETITDFSQQTITVRRSLVKSLDIFFSFIPEIFDFPEFSELISYIGEMACSFIESTTPKLALVFLGKLINKIAMNHPEHDISKHIITVCYQISIEIITKKKNKSSYP